MFQRSRVSIRHRAMTAAAAVGLLSTILLTAASASAAQPPAADDPSVITTWNEIAVNTIADPVAAGGAGKGNVEGFLWFSFVQAAVYNAVVGITHEYDLYKWEVRGPTAASPEAAAAVAAHRVLMEYFGSNPVIATNLDARLAASLGSIPDSVSKNQGMRYGIRAADHFIDLRADDGRFAPVTFDVPPAAGVWRPTPPALAPFFDPWLGQVDPLTLDSPSQFRPGPPPAISSALYVEEFNEVRDYGAKVSAVRTQAQTDVARFFADSGVKALQTGLRDLAVRHNLDISDSARLFAAVDMSQADAAIAVWDAKLLYAWWRPITAIREGDADGNPDTTGVPGWEPLITTPPYPDWPSGLCGIIGAASTVLSRLNPDGDVDLTMTSLGSNITFHFDDPAVMQQMAIDARVWSGIHFRTADAISAAMGTNIANWALDHYFAPSK